MAIVLLRLSFQDGLTQKKILQPRHPALICTFVFRITACPHGIRTTYVTAILRHVDEKRDPERDYCSFKGFDSKWIFGLNRVQISDFRFQIYFANVHTTAVAFHTARQILKRHKVMGLQEHEINTIRSSKHNKTQYNKLRRHSSLSGARISP